VPFARRVIERHGDTVGRNTDEIEKTAMIALCYGAPKEREDAMSAVIGAMSQTTPELARKQMIIGSRDECLETIDSYTKVGVTHFIFMMMAPYFVDDLQHFAEDVIPAAKS
jgi:alkanesulfonate monooxygenase SsuD/methylene tetrahydromethanopterin reductase-like flavin-dependent oxidoreductase (luciferase family)